jgi:hypothetical protein
LISTPGTCRKASKTLAPKNREPTKAHFISNS